jgi:hypothetical protein
VSISSGVTWTRLATDVLGRLGGAAVLLGAGTRGDLQTGQRGELAAHLVGDAVGEVRVVRAAEVLEGEHGQALDRTASSPRHRALEDQEERHAHPECGRESRTERRVAPREPAGKVADGAAGAPPGLDAAGRGQHAGTEREEPDREPERPARQAPARNQPVHRNQRDHCRAAEHPPHGPWRRRLGRDRYGTALQRIAGRAERDGQLARRSVSVHRVPRGGLGDHVARGRRYPGAHRPDRPYLFGQRLGENRLGRGPLEGRLARQHLEQHRPHRVHVGAGVHAGLAQRLFRAHVLRRSQSEARLRERLRARTERARDPEVGDERVARAEQDVRGLDVAVDDPPLMGVCQRVRDFPGQAQRVVRRQRTFPVQPLAQRLSLHERHHVVQHAVHVARIVHRQDVWVIELGRDLDLAQEAVGAQRGGQLGAHHLHGHLPAVLEVLREIDGGHPALAQDPLDPVPVRQRGPHLRHLVPARGRGARRHTRLSGSRRAALEAELRLPGEGCVAGRTDSGWCGHGLRTGTRSSARKGRWLARSRKAYGRYATPNGMEWPMSDVGRAVAGGVHRRAR